MDPPHANIPFQDPPHLHAKHPKPAYRAEAPEVICISSDDDDCFEQGPPQCRGGDQPSVVPPAGPSSSRTHPEKQVLPKRPPDCNATGVTGAGGAIDDDGGMDRTVLPCEVSLTIAAAIQAWKVQTSSDVQRGGDGGPMQHGSGSASESGYATMGMQNDQFRRIETSAGGHDDNLPAGSLPQRGREGSKQLSGPEAFPPVPSAPQPPSSDTAAADHQRAAASSIPPPRRSKPCPAATSGSLPPNGASGLADTQRAANMTRLEAQLAAMKSYSLEELQKRLGEDTSLMQQVWKLCVDCTPGRDRRHVPPP